MKFRITFKDPDGVSECLTDAAKTSVNNLSGPFTDHETTLLIDSRRDDAKTFANKYIRWSEYITVEFDTEEGTAKVIENDDDY